MKLSIAPMSPDDLREVMELERNSFSSPWSRGMYLRELEKDDGCYLTVRGDGALIAYGGILVILDEAHIMTLTVREGFRRRGVALCLLLGLAERAEEMGARFLTLEVRKSNRAAIELYGKLGFQIMGERKNYYVDNFENALIMWTEDITTPEYRGILEDLRRRYCDGRETG